MGCTLPWSIILIAIWSWCWYGPMTGWPVDDVVGWLDLWLTFLGIEPDVAWVPEFVLFGLCEIEVFSLFPAGCASTFCLLLWWFVLRTMRPMISSTSSSQQSRNQGTKFLARYSWACKLLHGGNSPQLSSLICLFMCLTVWIRESYKHHELENCCEILQCLVVVFQIVFRLINLSWYLSAILTENCQCCHSVQ